MQFGAELRHLWPLEAGVAHLNHGGYGAAPHAVLAEQRRWRDRLERNPVRFMADELRPALRQAADALVRFLGADPEGLVFVDNATAGVGTVLRSLNFAPGGEILLTDHGYPAVAKAVAHVGSRSGARAVVAQLPCPLPGPQAVLDAVAAAITPRTRLAVFDHVTSPSAAILPVAELAALCRARGVPVLVDGAHAPGMLELDLAAIGVDWYVGNCHKWLCAPKGSGFLWARDAHARAAIHPLVTSHGYGEGFQAEFAWTGTRDPSAWLAVPAALDVHRSLDPAALRTYCHGLVLAEASALAGALGTELAAPAAMTGFMAALRLPAAAGTDWPDAFALVDRLWREHRIVATAAPLAGALWLRLSAFAYNAPEDYAGLAAALRETP